MGPVPNAGVTKAWPSTIPSLALRRPHVEVCLLAACVGGLKHLMDDADGLIMAHAGPRHMLESAPSVFMADG